MNRDQMLEQMADRAPNLKIVEVVAHLPSGPKQIPVDAIQEWNPSMGALAWKTKDGRVHNLHNAVFEIVFEESRIARPA